MLAAGIGAFPLAIAESAVIAAILFAVEAAALVANRLAVVSGGPEMLWLLALIAGASGFAAASQLKLLVALVDEAIRDPLTGCLRRESGAELLDAQLNLARRRGAPLALLFADLDRFKAVNDEFGHEAGDGVLATAAAALREITRDSDVAIRWGGEEFVLALVGTEGDAALTTAERYRAAIQKMVAVDGNGHPIAVTASIGVADFQLGDTADSVIDRADRSMYAAKTAGRNRVRPEVSGAVKRELAAALDNTMPVLEESAATATPATKGSAASPRS